MVKVLNRSLGDFEFYRDRFKSLRELSPAAVTVLNCFKERPETHLQTREIVEATDFPRSTTNDALRMLTKQGFVQRLGRGAGVRYQLVF
jgi:predicted transcriptional regulator